jgi:hypothetical protein
MATKNRALGKSNMSHDEKYAFASAEEKANRIGTGYPPGEDPADNGPTFKQIESATTSKNMNEPAIDSRSGNQKFGSV